MPLWAKYHDEDGRLSRTLEFGGYGRLGGRLLPREMHMRPADAPGERTTIRYRNLEFDVDLRSSFFSLRNLRRRRVASHARGAAMVAYRLAQPRPASEAQRDHRRRTGGRLFRGRVHGRMDGRDHGRADRQRNVAGRRTDRGSRRRIPPREEPLPTPSAAATASMSRSSCSASTSTPSVAAAAPRAYAGALISSGAATSAGVLMGVAPDREVAVSRFLDDLAAGRLPLAGRRELVMGEEMAAPTACHPRRRDRRCRSRGGRLHGQRPLCAGGGCSAPASSSSTRPSWCCRSSIFRS